MQLDLSPEHLLGAYATGVFPMADDAGVVHWLAPDPRAVIELDGFRTTRSLRQVLRRGTFEIAVNNAFDEVIRACADRAGGTWITREIEAAYCALHELGFAHSVEAWRDGRLAGGLYGVSLRGAFFGESMFFRVPNASKVALAALVTRMRERGFALLDVQFATDHLRRFGAREIPRGVYLRRLADALRVQCSFIDDDG
ncbi:MAG: leucyl/phenylalanyl-tRNA--protein transferase [Phycisphaerae bacterium]